MNLDRIPHIFHDTRYALKLFEIVYEKHRRKRQMWQELNNFKDYTKLSGEALDHFGGNYKIFREGLTDIEYMNKIKFELASISFVGNIEDLTNMLAFYFQRDPAEFTLLEATGKLILIIPDMLDIEEVKKTIKKVKSAGVGFLIDFDVYIIDFTLVDLTEKALTELTEIKLDRGEDIYAVY